MVRERSCCRSHTGNKTPCRGSIQFWLVVLHGKVHSSGLRHSSLLLRSSVGCVAFQLRASAAWPLQSVQDADKKCCVQASTNLQPSPSGTCDSSSSIFPSFYLFFLLICHRWVFASISFVSFSFIILPKSLQQLSMKI